MSRWIENFENHAFQEQWAQIIEYSQEIAVDDKTVKTDIQEVARLKKAIKFLNELMTACDPELIPSSTWDNFQAQSQACNTELKRYESSRNIGHIKNANNNLDNLLSYIRPYQVVAREAARASTIAFKEYSETIESSLSSFHEKADEILGELEEAKLTSAEKAKECTEINSSIIKLKESYFDDTKEESVNTKIINLADSIEQKHDKIVDLFTKIFEGDSDNDSIESEISDALEKAAEDTNEIKSLLEGVKKETKKYLEYHEVVFGTKNEEGEYEGGLKQEIEIKQNKLNLFKEQQERKYSALVTKIESLIPGATSAGLATAFLDLKNSFKWPSVFHSIVFYISVAVLTVLALTSVTQQVSFEGVVFINIQDSKELYLNLLHRLPIMAPTVWLAIFSSRRRSEAARLKQEYAHKEALAKSYQNFKKEIEDLTDGDDVLMKNLLSSAISAIAFNASATLDKKHGDSLPPSGLLEKAKEFVEKASD